MDEQESVTNFYQKSALVYKTRKPFLTRRYDDQCEERDNA